MNLRYILNKNAFKNASWRKGQNLGMAPHWVKLGGPHWAGQRCLIPNLCSQQGPWATAIRITHEAAQGETGEYTQPSPSSHSTENRKPRKEAAAMVWLWDT